MGSVLCEHCTGECCQYIALPIEEPEDKGDFDDIRWYLMHEGITVFVEEGAWYIQFRARCRNLQADFRCGVYEKRPNICREYESGDCDYAGGDYSYDYLFTEPQQIEEHMKEHLKEKTTANGRKKRRPGKRKVAQQKTTPLQA